MSEELTLQKGQKITNFLEDEDVKGALVALEKQYVAEFRESKDAAGLVLIQAKMNVIRDVVVELKKIVGAGERVRAVREMENRRGATIKR